MKRIILIFVLIVSFFASMANNGLIYTSVEEGVRIEAINNHAFFRLKPRLSMVTK